MKILETVEACRDLRARLKNGEVTVAEAHVQARILGAEARAIELAIDAARLTGRLSQDQGYVPDTELGQP